MDGLARARKQNVSTLPADPSPASCGWTRVAGATKADAGEEDLQVQHCESLGFLGHQTKGGESDLTARALADRVAISYPSEALSALTAS